MFTKLYVLSFIVAVFGQYYTSDWIVCTEMKEVRDGRGEQESIFTANTAEECCEMCKADAERNIFDFRIYPNKKRCRLFRDGYFGSSGSKNVTVGKGKLWSSG